MKSISIGLIVMLLLAGCAPQIDRCSADPTLPDCQAARASANATIAAIDSDRAATNREATRQAKAAEAAVVVQQTQAAAGVKATAIAVSAFSTRAASEANAQATKNALEIQAMNQSLMVSATIAAINVDTARVKASIELSTTTLIGKAEVDQKQMEADTSTSRTALWLALIGFAVVVIVLSVSFSVRRVANAAANFAEVRSALITHGQRAWLITPGPDGSKHVKQLTNMLGDYGASNALDEVLDQLEVPDREKLQALIEFNRQRAAVDISANIHAWPDVYSDSTNQASIEARPPAESPHYQLVAPTERPLLLASVPQAVDVLDAEWRKVEMSA